MDRLTYTVPEVSKMLGVSEATVHLWRGQGLIQAVQPAGAGGRYLVLADSLKAMLAGAR